MPHLNWNDARQEINDHFDYLVDEEKVTYKALAKEDIGYFAYHYLGLDIPRHQYRWFDLTDKYNRLLLLAPRGHGKTTSMSRVWVEYNSLFKTDYRTLLLSKSSDQAAKSFYVLYEDFKKNKLYRKDFKEEMKSFKKKKNQIWINTDKTQRDGTIESSGMEGGVTGAHFDAILADDIIDERTVRTKKSIEDTSRIFSGTIVPLLEPGGRIVVIGTRKHFADIYGDFIKNPLWYVNRDRAILREPEKFQYVKDALGNVKEIRVQGKSHVLWPERWPIKKLLLLRFEMGTIMFNREIQNDTSGLSGNTMNIDWLRYWEPKDLYYMSGTKEGQLKKNLTIYQSYDLAISEKQSADYFVGITAGVDEKNNIYILDIFRSHLSFPKQVRKVIELAKTWNPALIGVESNAYQKALVQQVDDIAFLPLEEVYNAANKETRIRTSSVYYEKGKVYLPQHLQLTSDFETEYLEFPRSSHDDQLDAADILFGLVKETTVNVDPSLIVGYGSAL
jgi:predicted phage terminase large subunit-like protein